MKKNYSLKVAVIVSVLLFQSIGLTQEPQNNNQQENRKRIIFGLAENAPPVSSRKQSGIWSGYCADFIKELNNYINSHSSIKVEIEIEEVTVSNNRFTGKSDKGSMLAGECGPNTIKKNRLSDELNAAFSKPFASTGAKILLKKHNTQYFYSQGGFQGKKIGVISSKTKPTTTERLISLVYTSAEIIFVPDRDKAIEMLEDDKIDAFASDEIILKSILKELDQEEGQKYAILPENYLLSHEEYGLVVYNLSQNRDLLDDINNFLGEQKAEEIRKKYFVDNEWLIYIKNFIYKYDFWFLGTVITITIFLTMLFHPVIIFILVKITPSSITKKFLQFLDNKISDLRPSSSKDNYTSLTIIILTTVESFVYYSSRENVRKINLENVQFGGSMINSDTVNTAKINGNINEKGQNEDDEKKQNDHPE